MLQDSACHHDFFIALFGLSAGLLGFLYPVQCRHFVGADDTQQFPGLLQTGF